MNTSLNDKTLLDYQLPWTQTSLEVLFRRTVTGESQEWRNGTEAGDTGKDNLSNLTVLLKTSPAQSNLEKYKC